MKFSIVSLLALPFLASAATTHTVKVGNGGLTFQPSSIKAAVGDKVKFEFDGSGHDVSQGDFGNACHPYSKNPFYSGTVNQGSDWTITVKNTQPIAFYCQPHCEYGMVGVINPSGAKTYAKYKKAATSAGSSVAPSKVQGGVFS